MLDFWMQELKKLSAEREAAWDLFNRADPEFRDAAVDLLKASEERLNAYFKLVRAAARVR